MNFRRIYTVLLVGLLPALSLHAQDVREDSLRNAGGNTLSLHFLVDGYYGYDFAQKAPGNRQPFFYSSNRHNEFSVNLAMLDALYSSERVRGRLALGFGTYFEANYAAEPVGLRNLFEASVGVKLLKDRDLWLDAGVLPSPYGYEGAISLDQLTYTRSLSAENSPYYVTGAKLTYPLSDKLTLAVFVLNGWQNIRENNAAKSVATQLQYKPNSRLLLNWSTYAGSEHVAADTSAGIADNGLGNRWFSDVYVWWQAGERTEVLALFDIGRQEYQDGREADVWFTANAMARYRVADHWAVSGRVEYFRDAQGVLIASQAAGVPGFTAYGGSVGADFTPADNVRFRLEYRLLASPDGQFRDRESAASKVNQFVTASLSARF